MSTKKPEVDDAAQLPVVSLQQSAAEAFALTTLKYNDTLYTSRSLFLSDGRELKVLRGQVEVQVDDAEALAYLDGNPEFMPLAE